MFAKINEIDLNQIVSADLTKRETFVYIALKMLAKGTDQTPPITLEEIGSILGFSRQRTNDIITTLKKKNIIKTEIQKGINSYHFVPQNRVQDVPQNRVQDVPQNRVQDVPQNRVQIPETHINSNLKEREREETPPRPPFISASNWCEPVKIYIEYEKQMINGSSNPHFTDFQAGKIRIEVTDVDRWKKTCDFWASNNYQFKNVANMLSKYHEMKPTEEKPTQPIRREIEYL
jgi:hypothetical protein